MGLNGDALPLSTLSSTLPALVVLNGFGGLWVVTTEVASDLVLEAQASTRVVTAAGGGGGGGGGTEWVFLVLPFLEEKRF